MKIFKIYFLLALAGMFSLTSCEDYFGDINVDPDNPTAVPPNVILPQVQVRLAYTLGGDASRYVGIYTQHIDGVGRQFAVIHKYGIQPTDVDAMWGQNLYSAVLMDNRQMMAIAEAAGNNHFVAVGKAIEAYAMMLITDLWGDAPYSESFQGLDLLQPKFDSQESIYNEIFTLIGDAKALFAGDDGGFPLTSASDLIYGGDASKWIKFLNVLEARGLLHLSGRDGGNYDKALAALANGFTSSDDNATLTFGSNPTENAPWFQYNEQRDDIDIGSNYVALMDGLNDPRVATYGFELTESVPHPILTPTQSLPLLTYTEAKFIEAEARLQISGAADAEAPYLEAIQSSFSEALVDGYADYILQDAVVPAGGITLKEVITQKYIALFMDPEPFSDWRRTGFPELTPNIPPTVPRRLPYADNEVKSNLNTPSLFDVTIFSRVWWDVE